MLSQYTKVAKEKIENSLKTIYPTVFVCFAIFVVNIFQLLKDTTKFSGGL